MKSVPRGIRNNNPLNIRIGNYWMGEVKDPSDPVFEQFTRIEYGLRAGFKILKRYIERYNRMTLRLVVLSWAPACENDVLAYIRNVSEWSGIAPDDILRFSDADQMCRLVQAMCRQECGVTLSIDIVREGYSLVH